MEGKWCLQGKVEKIKVLKLEEMPLVRFTLTDERETRENCLIKNHSLNFLFQVTEGKSIVIYGKRINKIQFVVQKYHVK